MSFLPTDHAAFLASHSANPLENYDSNNNKSPSRRMMMSSVACRDGTIVIRRGSKNYNMAYRVFRPNALTSQQQYPLVVIHGGPSVPCDYLLPLVDVLSPPRSIILFDQLGCGRSDRPINLEDYSIDLVVQDLHLLIQSLKISKFHLYGQSFGGIVAYEYLKKFNPTSCASVILSSTPTSIALVEQEAQRLLLETNQPTPKEQGEAFHAKHVCRLNELPRPLQSARENAGTLWRGTTAIAEYSATPSSDNKQLPPLLVLRGEFDFVTEECVSGWNKLWNEKHVTNLVLEGCAHHGLLEKGTFYGEAVGLFCYENDNNL